MNSITLKSAHTVNDKNCVQLVYIMSQNETHTMVRDTLNRKLTIANNLIFTTFTQAAAYRDEQQESVSWWVD